MIIVTVNKAKGLQAPTTTTRTYKPNDYQVCGNPSELSEEAPDRATCPAIWYHLLLMA